MKELNETVHSLDSINAHLVKTAKFKTYSFVMMLKAPLEEETVAYRALLPHVLQSATAKTSERAKFRQRLDDLYGAMLATDVQKKGEDHVISFRLDVANEKFLSEKTSLLKEGIELLKEIIFEPLVDGEAFKKEIVESEKRSLVQRIESVFDDKMRYANVRITEEMFKGERYALTSFGTKEQVQAITASELYTYYQNILETNRFDLYVVGDFHETELKETLTETFSGIQLANNVKELPSSEPNEIKEKKVFDEQDVKQGKLHIGFRANTTFADPDYVAMQVCNGLFGGFSHSKLFINVREKESLAYYAASRFESHKGLIMVMSGIEFGKYDRAVEIIKEQMDAMKKGDFTEAEIEQTKAMLINQLLESVDVARGFVELAYHQVVSGHQRTIEQWIEQIQNVTKDEIVQAAQKIELDTIYFLKGKGV
ncbi:zinc protease [Alkalihalobacillus alcalophilus ATCC 27647 = CGMCC 1.3604]|uniref:Zinc protease n=1 Tax=Alkalihalobacillus alcalophilus ATCC 27647 = CGMCC 1.3604 TaxID=1218173 RepID=A0A094WR52_ALKAL|nr:pitrilysin family protein [Alkalihalobacillus alcalophilus]KGA98538.1 zinc protease [Alkalihalobacillus alcalophilus ATCC 27647 = CGMCC 1.3604]MED1562689.1 pitrilysin family protein [Alkalihalobacillus alcalophilus]THG91682.1 zinc protease [Alkalihalobacillus alcalophilus ATCC 27647 = CGMCC 1.3604]